MTQSSKSCNRQWSTTFSSNVYKEVSLQGLGPKNKGTQSMDMEKQSLVVLNKGKTIG